jgi:23S rRNA (cytosine1962-C5)-methyltransferase
MNSLPCVTLNRHAEERARKRHPWVFSNELSDPKRFARLEPGSLVDVLDCHGDYLGTGFVNPHSLIAVRILSRERGLEIDGAFFRAKLASALDTRDALYGPKTPSRATYRAVFGEGDGLPGLIIDRFEGAWVVEPHAKGMEVRTGLVVEAIQTLAAERYGEKDPAIVVRTDHRAAQLEGMESRSELVAGKLAGVFAVEDGIRFPVDPVKGQKTGFFFDQRDNRTFFRDWVAGRGQLGRESVVLDIFCHAGAWGLRALKAGAKRATFVDSSASALEMVKAAAADLGLLDRVECIQSDAAEAIRALPKGGFNLVALDPPALIPNKKSVPAGSRNYRELNGETIRIVRAGGALSTSSCSYHLHEDRFEELVQKALVESGREARLLRRGGLSADHPLLPAMEEGRYLKNFFLAL